MSKCISVPSFRYKKTLNEEPTSTFLTVEVLYIVETILVIQVVEISVHR